MKSCIGFTLILLGLSIQASSTENTTKSYYFELQIESSAYDRFVWLLRNIKEFSVEQATVRNIQVTTDCTLNSCYCTENYTWSTDVCKMYPACCDDRKSCPSVPPGAMCLYSDRVLVNGLFTIEDKWDISDKMKEFLTEKLTSVFSTVDWFDSLTINSLRRGSIIADFEMLINGPFIMEKLVEKTKSLGISLSASFTIVTTGFIKISTAPNQIGYHTFANITCTTPTELSPVSWSLQKGNQRQTITNGTEANVNKASLESMVCLTKTSEVWKGIFTCDYTVNLSASGNIIHRASAYLDVALLPTIFITSEPQFPNCKTGSTQPVDVKCIIDNSTETYTVNWYENDKLKKTDSGANTTEYIYQTFVECSGKQETSVTCSFKNRANNMTSATLNIPVIYSNSVVCPSNEDWPEAKADFSAKLQCNPTETGYKTRECKGLTNPGTWGTVISKCVSTTISSLLNTAQGLQKGCGLVKENANMMLEDLRQISEEQVINTFPNIEASVNVLDIMHMASDQQKSKLNNSVVTDFVKFSSNLLNTSVLSKWTPTENTSHKLAAQYLKAVEGFANQISTTMEKPKEEENVQLIICNGTEATCKNTFNITLSNMTTGLVYQTKIKNLPTLLQKPTDALPGEFILSVTADTTGKIFMDFPNKRLPNHKIRCVFFNFNTSAWSDNGCKWGGVKKPDVCECDHFSAFTSLMSTQPETLPYMDQITYVGLGFSICSLVLCLVIEFVVWNTVVKSNISHFRHTVLVNIALCLLIAHCSFLVASSENSAPSQWCLALTVMKHFCFLAVFFWMLCMSLGLLHQMIFVFVQLRKKVYLGLCFSLGYVCPLCIVICTIITYNNGAAESYYVKDTCWLKYEDILKGSIYSFVIPVGIIVLVNMFTMVVVISRILKPNLSEGKSHDEKEIVRSVIRTVVLLTPTLGITWIFGFFVLMVDLTEKPWAEIINYGFTLLNSFQGFFILLTGCFGEKKVRDALLLRIRPQHSEHYTSKSSVTMTAAVKKK